MEQARIEGVIFDLVEEEEWTPYLQCDDWRLHISRVDTIESSSVSGDAMSHHIEIHGTRRIVAVQTTLYVEDWYRGLDGPSRSLVDRDNAWIGIVCNVFNGGQTAKSLACNAQT